MPKAKKKNGRGVRHRAPPTYWDKLSYVPFVKGALEEFDRRSKQPFSPLPPLSCRLREDRIPKLKLFAKHGGPDLSVLRGYPNPDEKLPNLPVRYSSSIIENPMPKQTGPNKKSKDTEANFEYDEAFMQHLLDYGLRLKVARKVDERPSNWEEIWDRLRVSHRSLSRKNFTADDFAKFDLQSFNAVDEDKTLKSVIPIIIGKSADIPHEERISFSNLQDLTDGFLPKAKPCFYDGSEPSEIDQRIKKKIGPYILPVKADDRNDENNNGIAGEVEKKTAAPCLPNFFMEVLGADGEGRVGRRLAFYHGLLGARGVHELRSLINQKNLLDNRAYTITSVYHNHRKGSSLTLYTVHPFLIREQSEDPLHKTERLGYRLSQLGRFEMLDAQENLQAGACALRNARDWAAEQREKLIEKANNFQRKRVALRKVV